MEELRGADQARGGRGMNLVVAAEVDPIAFTLEELLARLDLRRPSGMRDPRAWGRGPERLSFKRGAPQEEAFAYCRRCDVQHPVRAIRARLRPQPLHWIWAGTSYRDRRIARSNRWDGARLLEELG
jgi:hypothetical protein